MPNAIPPTLNVFQLTSSLKENPRLKAAADELKKTGVKVGDAVGEALKSMEESEIIRTISRATSAVSSTIEKSTEPIRKTAAYKSLSESIIDALDDSGSAKHAGFEEKEARRLRRQRRLIKAGKAGRLAHTKTDANPEYVSCPPEQLPTHSRISVPEKQ